MTQMTLNMQLYTYLIFLFTIPNLTTVHDLKRALICSIADKFQKQNKPIFQINCAQYPLNIK